MRRYRYEIDNVRAHLRSLWAVIGLQALVIFALWFGWSQAPKTLTVHVPPDLRSGAVLAVDQVPPANVYAFAFYIFQQLNRWPEDGARDYGRAIFSVSPYLTPKYRTDLIADMELKGRQGELAYRVRGMQEIPGHGYEERRVDVLNARRLGGVAGPRPVRIGEGHDGEEDRDPLPAACRASCGRSRGQPLGAGARRVRRRKGRGG